MEYIVKMITDSGVVLKETVTDNYEDAVVWCKYYRLTHPRSGIEIKRLGY